MKRKYFLFLMVSILLFCCFGAIQFYDAPTLTIMAAENTPSVKISTKTLYVESTVDNSYKISLKNVTSVAKVSYKSSDSNIATVSKTGVVTAKSKGKATITVTIKQGGKTYTSKVTVTVKNPYILITNKTDSVYIGESYQFTAKAYGLGGASYSWWTSDKTVATISKNGTLKPLKPGTVKVTVKDTTNDKYSFYTLEVKSAPQFSVFLSSDSNQSKTVFAIVTNNSQNTITITSENSYLFDYDYDSYNRELVLIDVNDFSIISSCDIAPGEKCMIGFMSTTTATWYDKKSTITFSVEYDGDVFLYSASSYYGTNLMNLD